MGRCARAAWDHAVEEHRRSVIPRPGVTTGDVLLGVLREESCAGGLILARLPVDLKLIHATTEFVLLHGRRQSADDTHTEDWSGIRHSRAARQALDLTLEEANLTSSTYPIGTEHLLLGVLRVPESTGCRILHHFGVTEGDVRAGRDRLWELLRGIQ